jgi:DNA polymerase III subunit epsilon
VASHFSGHKITPQRQHFLRDIHRISFEVCATELMALLLECTEIKKLWPVYNKALKRFEAKYGLYEYEARSGYRYLAVGKLNKHQACIEAFNNLHDCVNLLGKLAEQFKIDNRFCKYCTSTEGEATPQYSLKNLPDVEHHNAQVESAIDFVKKNRPSFAIIDKGRYVDERSCVWVENGHFYGMGYIASDIGFTEPSELKDYVTPYKSNNYIMQLLYTYMEKHPGKVIIQQTLAVKE